METSNSSTNDMDIMEITASDTTASPTDSEESLAFISHAAYGSASNPVSLLDPTPPSSHPPLSPSHATGSSAVYGQESNHLTPRNHACVPWALDHRPSLNNPVRSPGSTDDSWVWVDPADYEPRTNARPQEPAARVATRNEDRRAVHDFLYRDGDNCQMVFHGKLHIPNGLMLRFGLRGYPAPSNFYANARGFSNELVNTLTDR